MRAIILTLAAAFALTAPLGACDQLKPPAPPQPASLEDGDDCFARREWNCAAANYNG